MKLTFMTPLEIYLLMDLFLCVFCVSLLYEIFRVCGRIFVVTAMGAPLSLSWQRPGIHKTSALHGRLGSVLNPSFQQFFMEKNYQSWVSVAGEQTARTMTSRPWHFNIFQSSTGENEVSNTHISKGKVNSGPGRVSLEESSQKFLQLCILGSHLNSEKSKAGIEKYFPSEIGSQMEGEIESLFQRK